MSKCSVTDNPFFPMHILHILLPRFTRWRAQHPGYRPGLGAVCISTQWSVCMMPTSEYQSTRSAVLVLEDPFLREYAAKDQLHHDPFDMVGHHDYEEDRPLPSLPAVHGLGLADHDSMLANESSVVHLTEGIARLDVGSREAQCPRTCTKLEGVDSIALQRSLKP